jgi:hypothetical protein
MESLCKYSNHIRNLFDFGEIKVEPLSDREASSPSANSTSTSSLNTT